MPAINQKTTFALFFGNRGFFPAALIAAARQEMTQVLNRLGHKTILLDAGATRKGGVETPAEGARYAQTPAGAQLRDALAGSPAVENLRRIWETLSLNVLDGPAEPDAAPIAWSELLADALVGHGLNDSILARLRPEGFA